MEENKNENGAGELNEEQLDAVAGGVPLKRENMNCFFTRKGDSKQINGNTWLKCNSSCGLLCGCYNTTHCIDKWHLINSDNTLSPSDYSNHKEKKPPSYNT